MFLLQPNQELNADISFLDCQPFDFYEDAGPENDGDNFIAKIQRLDIKLLENMKKKFEFMDTHSGKMFSNPVRPVARSELSFLLVANGDL